MAGIIQYVSIFIEIIIAVLGFLIALQKKKLYGWGIALTFAIYAFYDFVKLMGVSISEACLSGLFFIATLSALWFVFSLYKGGKKK